MNETVIHTAEHAPAEAAGAAEAIAASADRDLERTVGEHHAKIEAHDGAISEIREKLGAFEGRLDSLSAVATQAPIDVASEVRQQVEEVVEETLEAAKAAEEAAATPLEEVAPPAPATPPEPERKGFFASLFDHAKRLV